MNSGRKGASLIFNGTIMVSEKKIFCFDGRELWSSSGVYRGNILDNQRAQLGDIDRYLNKHA